MGTSKINGRRPPASGRFKTSVSYGMVGTRDTDSSVSLCFALCASAVPVKIEENEEVAAVSDSVVTVTSDTFQGTIGTAQVPVIVDFWASWCMPCRMISPILEELADAHQGGLMIAKVNVDENPALAEQFGVRSIPTLIRFDSGQETRRVVGALPKTQLTQQLGL